MSTPELYTFQKEDVSYLGATKSALIANEMGTGKTFEAIARDRQVREASSWGDKRSLWVAPLTTLSSIGEHLSLFGYKYVTIDPKNRDGTWKEFQDTRADFFLIHWEGVRLLPELKQVLWVHVIADECHRMKNRKAQQTLAVKRLKALHRTAMSGTPIVNRPDELWSVLNWLYPETYKAYWKFYERYVDYEISYPQGYRIVKGPKNVGELQKKIKSFTVRRLKKHVLKDLPDKYYTTTWVELDPKQRKAYNEMRKEMIAWVGEHMDTPLVAPVVIAKLVRLQQFAAAYMADTENGWRMCEPSSKLDTLMQILEDNPDEQIVVFSQFKQLVKLANARLEKAKISYVEVSGDINNAARGEAIKRFQAGGARVFTGTIAAGGVGITLTASSTIVFLDRSWSPATNVQAEDRLHRIGQTNAVQVIDILSRDTVDLGRMQRLELKWSWIRSLLGDVHAIGQPLI